MPTVSRHANFSFADSRHLEMCSRLSRLSVYEASSRGTVVNFLRKRALRLTVSEFFPEIPRGESRNGIQCQDLQALTFGDDAFDLCSSTEVFEHIADDQKAFKEILRVLRPGGTLAFTVPIHAANDTVQRARVVNGETVHLLPPAFHGDGLTGSNFRRVDFTPENAYC